MISVYALGHADAWETVSKSDRKAPGFGLKEYMEVAAHWSDIVMPNNYVEAERKAIEGPRG